MAAETMEFKNRLEDYLKENKVSIERFVVAVEDASDGHVSPSYFTVRSWLGGAIPQAGHQRAIAKVMGVEVSHLFPQD